MFITIQQIQHLDHTNKIKGKINSIQLQNSELHQHHNSRAITIKINDLINKLITKTASVSDIHETEINAPCINLLKEL